MRAPAIRLLTLALSVGICAVLGRTPGERGLEPGDDGRFLTDRQGARSLTPPGRTEDAFQFVVFGDRTGGPAEGIRVLEQAVEDTNLLGPELVLTVGDLIEGYNELPEWLEQMREFRGVMSRLDAPWFPVAGNHDVYWRGEGQRPPEEHEENYEEHFGPLWYAFEHRNSWFVVLYTDEGDPATGLRGFEPHQQTMSERQLAFLESALERAADADHVFLFLHHPRWLADRYGADWERVHERLVAAGNVRAVFAGHIHRMRYDPLDGIEYFSLATTGGSLFASTEAAGFVHEYHVVTVRRHGIDVTTYPVGAALDPRAVTGEMGDSAYALERSAPVVTGRLEAGRDGGVSGGFSAAFRNDASLPVRVRWRATSEDPHWRIWIDGGERTLLPGSEAATQVEVERAPGDVVVLAPVVLHVETEVVVPGSEEIAVVVPPVEVPLDLRAVPPPTTEPGEDIALHLDGTDDRLTVPSEALSLPDGPLTVEAWVLPESVEGVRGIVAKTEGSEFGLFVDGGRARFLVHLDGEYASIEEATPSMAPGRWYHVAGCFDGAELRLFVDGRRVAAGPASGTRTPNDLPLSIGADVTGNGGSASHFAGAIDEVHVSRVARYTEDFEPSRRFAGDRESVLLLHLDAPVGAYAWDASDGRRHARVHGGRRITVDAEVGRADR